MTDKCVNRKSENNICKSCCSLNYISALLLGKIWHGVTSWQQTGCVYQSNPSTLEHTVELSMKRIFGRWLLNGRTHGESVTRGEIMATDWRRLSTQPVRLHPCPPAALYSHNPCTNASSLRSLGHPGSLILLSLYHLKLHSCLTVTCFALYSNNPCPVREPRLVSVLTVCLFCFLFLNFDPSFIPKLLVNVVTSHKAWWKMPPKRAWYYDNAL